MTSFPTELLSLISWCIFIKQDGTKEMRMKRRTQHGFCFLAFYGYQTFIKSYKKSYNSDWNGPLWAWAYKLMKTIFTFPSQLSVFNYQNYCICNITCATFPFKRAWKFGRRGTNYMGICLPHLQIIRTTVPCTPKTASSNPEETNMTLHAIPGNQWTSEQPS